MENKEISPERSLSKNIAPDKEEGRAIIEFQKKLEQLKVFKCISRSTEKDDTSTIEKIDTLVEEYLNSKESGDDILFSKLEEVNKIIQNIIICAVKNEKLLWQKGKKPGYFQWKFNKGRVLKGVNRNFKENFCIGESTTWNDIESGGVLGQGKINYSSSSTALKGRINDIHFVLETWNNFYNAEKVEPERIEVEIIEKEKTEAEEIKTVL